MERGDHESRLILASILFSIPAFGVLAALSLSWRLEGIWVEAATEAGMHELMACATSAPSPFRDGIPEVCGTLDSIHLLRDVSIWLATASGILVAAIYCNTCISCICIASWPRRSSRPLGDI